MVARVRVGQTLAMGPSDPTASLSVREALKLTRQPGMLSSSFDATTLHAAVTAYE